MDQTINGMVYSGRINSTVRSWNDQIDGKVAIEGTIIASDGTRYRKEGNRLVQVLEPNMIKCVKKLESKLMADGLIKEEEKTASVESASLVNDSELIAEL